MATAAAAWANAVKAAFDAKANPPAPTVGQVTLSSGKPAVFGLDADDVAAFDALGTDAVSQTLTAAEAAPATPAPADPAQ